MGERKETEELTAVTMLCTEMNHERMSSGLEFPSEGFWACTPEGAQLLGLSQDPEEPEAVHSLLAGPEKNSTETLDSSGQSASREHTGSIFWFCARQLCKSELQKIILHLFWNGSISMCETAAARNVHVYAELIHLGFDEHNKWSTETCFRLLISEVGGLWLFIFKYVLAIWVWKER